MVDAPADKTYRSYGGITRCGDGSFSLFAGEISGGHICVNMTQNDAANLAHWLAAILKIKR
jgi:hypothetical protein